MAIQPGNAGAIRGIQIELHDPAALGQAPVEQRQQVIEAGPGRGRAHDHVRLALGLAGQLGARLGPEQIALVPQLDQPALVGEVGEPEIRQHPQHILILRGMVGVGEIAHMDQQIGALDLFQGRPEGRDQIGRQVGHEAHGVGQDRLLARRQAEQAHGRIERREQLVARRHLGAGDPVEQGRLAGVGVADQGDHRIGHPPARAAMQATGALDGLELALDPPDALVDPAPVELDLAFARAAQEAEAAALPLQVGPGPDQARALIGQGRQLDLQAALLGLGAGAEDLEDQTGPVDDLAFPGALEITLLDRRQGGIDHDQLDRLRRDPFG